MIATFFGHPEIVKLLLENKAPVNAVNKAGRTPLDAASREWGPAIEGLYKYIASTLQLEIDLERVQASRPQIAELLKKHGAKLSSELSE